VSVSICPTLAVGHACRAIQSDLSHGLGLGLSMNSTPDALHRQQSDGHCERFAKAKKRANRARRHARCLGIAWHTSRLCNGQRAEGCSTAHRRSHAHPCTRCRTGSSFGAAVCAGLTTRTLQCLWVRAPRLLLCGIGALVGGDEPALAQTCSCAWSVHTPYACDGAVAICSQESRGEQLQRLFARRLELSGAAVRL